LVGVLKKDGILLVTGGTGSFGKAVVDRFIDSELKEIRIFSRDEDKQDSLRSKLKNNSKLKFYIGDVRDYRSVENAMSGVDYVFHAAALKQVPSCEFFPTQAVKTNITGTENVLHAARAARVKRVIGLSTDKAVYPINAMGMTKALMEKVLASMSRDNYNGETVFCSTRYGNVMASRGSVIPRFINQILTNSPISITDPNMTRFMMTLDDAVDLVLYAFDNASPGDLFVQKSPAATVGTIASALKEIFNSDSRIKIIGARHGEKTHETLLTREERYKAIESDKYFRIPADLRDLNYENYISKGKVQSLDEYNSENTHRLTTSETIEMLMKLKVVRESLLKIN
jgi:UDP-glucose 4-epimerase